MASTSGCTQRGVKCKCTEDIHGDSSVGSVLEHLTVQAVVGGEVSHGSSGCTQQLGKLELLDGGRGMGELNVVSEYLTAQGLESVHGSLSSTSFLSAGQCGSVAEGMGKSLVVRGESRIKEKIELSKEHWSLLADNSDSDDEAGEGVVAEVDNVEVFKALQMHLTWGGFFLPFDHNMEGRFKRSGELVVGEKFAEGGQAELYHAQVKWVDARMLEWDLENGREWVVKIFKEGTFLRQLYKALPCGYLQWKVEEWKNWSSATPLRLPRYYCHVDATILMEDGRLGFLMKKEHFDLRDLIERHMELRSSEDCGPFSHEDAQWLMYMVAMGVKWLHEHDIVHRDLKASNVLVKEHKNGWPKWICNIADFECSVGVVGTGFFRAPEILQACKDGQVKQRPEVFSKAADVYSYGMTCYEILTGKLPYGPQVVVREYVDEWTRFLLSRCWQLNPLVRPSMEEIVSSFLDHSPKIRQWQAEEDEYWRKLNQQS